MNDLNHENPENPNVTKKNTHQTESQDDRQKSNRRRPKFTKGETCLFTHLVITFVIILLLILVYILHLLLVNHQDRSILQTRRQEIHNDTNNYENLLTGLLYLNLTPHKMICYTLLVRPDWSVAPAHCVAMRSDPELIKLLFSWRIKYSRYFLYSDVDVIRGVIHSKFNYDDFSHNIGLFEHSDAKIPVDFRITPFTKFNEATSFENSESLFIKTYHQHHFNMTSLPITKLITVQILRRSKCSHFTNPIVELRKYEFCLAAMEPLEAPLRHGAVAISNSKVIGFFSWGDTKGTGMPFIFLNIALYKDWMDEKYFI